jgi:hypothetical protein
VFIMSSPEPTRPSAGPEEPRRLSDSPLLWFFVFGMMGLLALVVIAPKHARRQERLERMADSRERPFIEHAVDPSEISEQPPADESSQVEEPFRRDEARPVDGPLGTSSSREATPQPQESPRPGKTPLSRSLVPLMAFLAAVLAIVAAAVGMARYLRLAEARAEARKREQIE